MDMDQNTSSKKHSLPIDVYNQFVRFICDSEFRSIVDNQRNKYNNFTINGSKLDFYKESYQIIRSYLRKNHVPLNWDEPIYNLITLNEYDFPLDSAIRLKFGSQTITNRTDKIMIIKKEGQFVDEPCISIDIVTKVSIQHLIKFIKRNWNVILWLQKELELPKYRFPIWKRVDLALKVIALRNVKKLSFSDISTRLSAFEELSREEQNYLGDENNVKDLYYRFKPILFRKK